MATLKKDIRLVYFLTLIIIVACSTSVSEAALPQPVNTALPIFTSTNITETPFNTNTPFILTETPLPTLNPEDAYTQLQDLLKNNANCRLPCWWGITPGKTSWQDASRFLKTFSNVKSENELGVTSPNNDYVYYYAYFQVPREFGTLNHSYVVKDNLVIKIYAYVFDWSPFLYLSNVLTEYGPPDGIFITTYRNELNGMRPYLIYLVYEKLGILLEYSGGDAKNIGDTVQNCFEELDSPFVYIWSTDEPLTAKEALDKYFRQPMAYPVAIEKAAGMDINTFYEKFKNPSSANCVVTPAELWTEP